MRICGRYFTPDIIAGIEKTIAATPSLSRRALSLQVCEWLHWRAANGAFQQVSCRKALLELERRGAIALPTPNHGCFRRSSRKQPHDLPELPVISGTLDQLGEVQLIPISSRDRTTSDIWNSLMERFHSRGKGPLCGAQIRYLINSRQQGWLGGLAFSAATWRLKARDQYIGWSETARRANLQRVVCNSRFLILPTVRVTHLASHVLQRCTERLGDDWIERYGYAPVLLESFVDRRRSRGACYRAANWTCVGQTAARSSPYRNGKIADGAKAVYLYPMNPNWQKVLCTSPSVPLCSIPRRSPSTQADAAHPRNWIEDEFGTAPFFDERLKERLFTLAADFFAQPKELIPQACNGSVAKTKGAYRFFANPNVDMETILRPHIESTIERMRLHPLILAVQDTSTLNYTAHAPEGVGPINTRQDQAVGLLLHDTMAFTPAGTPLGLLNVQCWARDPEEAEKKVRRKELPIAEKESMKWLTSYRAVTDIQRLCPQTMLISVGDREADIYELFYEASREPLRAKLLIRAERTRQRRVDQQSLWETMRDKPVAGYQEVAIPRKGSRPARKAKLAVRFAAVELRPPHDSELPAVPVWAVYAREVDSSPEVKEPIEWMVLTTVATDHFEAACQRLRWYARRWGIEVYHRTIKSGCRIEDHRLDDVNSLRACLAIDLVVGWRVYWLTMAGRETPQASCAQFFREDEWRVLSAWATGTMAAEPPRAQQMMRWTGKLGGWLGRKRDGEPGTICVWRGLIRIPLMVAGYRLAVRIHNIRDGP